MVLLAIAAAAGRMDGRACLFDVDFYTLKSHVWGHDEVRTKHVMSSGAHTWEGWSKSQSATHYFDRTAFRNFWGTTATDNQINRRALFNQNPDNSWLRRYQCGTEVAIIICESESMMRHQHGERGAACSRPQQEHVFTVESEQARGQLIPVHSSNCTPFFVFSFVTVLPFPGAISAPASVFRTPIMPSWSVCESERHNVVGRSSHPHSPASILCATGLLPDVTYRVDTPLATSGCFSNPLSSALSWRNFASCALISRLLPALSSLIDCNQ